MKDIEFVLFVIGMSWAFFGFFWMVLCIAFGIAENLKVKAEACDYEPDNWKLLDKSTKKTILRECSKNLWRGPKQYVIGFILIGIAAFILL